MVTPDAIDEVGISLMTTGGSVFYSNAHYLKPGVRLPPLDLGVAPSEGAIRAIAVGFRQGAPKVFREAIATSPEKALQLLQVGLDWENWGSAALESFPSVSASVGDVSLLADVVQGHTRVYHGARWVRNACPAGQTPLGGICASAEESNLPEYNEDLERGGPGRKCFGIQACMEGGFTLVQPTAVGKTCVAQLGPDVMAWVGDGSALNVAAEVEIVAGTTRVLPTNRNKDPKRLDGWQLDVASAKLSLPLPFCKPDPAWVMPVSGVADTATTYDWAWKPANRVLLSTRCENKTRALPSCQVGGDLTPVDVRPTQGQMPVALTAVKDATQPLPEPANDTLIGLDVASSAEALGVVLSYTHAFGTGESEGRWLPYRHLMDQGALAPMRDFGNLMELRNNTQMATVPARIVGADQSFVVYAPGDAQRGSVALLDARVASSPLVQCTMPGLRHVVHTAAGASYFLRGVEWLGGGAAQVAWGMQKYAFTNGECVPDSTSMQTFPKPASGDLVAGLLRAEAPADFGYAGGHVVTPVSLPERSLPANVRVVAASYSSDKKWLDVVSVENESDAATRRFSYWALALDGAQSQAAPMVSALQGPPAGTSYEGGDSGLRPAPHLFSALGEDVFAVEAKADAPYLVRLRRDATVVQRFELRGMSERPWTLVARRTTAVGAARVYMVSPTSDGKGFDLFHVDLPAV